MFIYSIVAWFLLHPVLVELLRILFRTGKEYLFPLLLWLSLSLGIVMGIDAAFIFVYTLYVNRQILLVASTDLLCALLSLLVVLVHIVRASKRDSSHTKVRTREKEPILAV